MSMIIKYACCNSEVPPAFTAWGTYTLADNPKTGTCKMTDSSSGIVNGTTPTFRSDGIWTSQLSGLTVGTEYKLDASYTKMGGGVVYAATETNLTVVNGAIVVPPPAEGTERVYALVKKPAAGAMQKSSAAKKKPAVKALMSSTAKSFSSSYPPFLDIEQVVAVVHEKLKPHKHASVTPGVVGFGKWTIIVPEPGNLSTVAYFIEFLFLDKNGIVVMSTRLNF